ncbi:MAG: enoyl-CoA hydratase/isomerase family protein, partial [Pseudomonadota bacterium]
AQRQTILSKSPTCTEIAFRQIRAGASLSFEECMRLEYRLARFCMTHPDFYEGVRAVIIDKDNAPVWSPAALDHVTTEMVDAAFAPLGPEELKL